MNNSYLSECFVKIPGIQKPKSLAKVLRSLDHIQTQAPEDVKKSMYEFYYYRITVYHPDVEGMVTRFLERPDLKFKVLSK